MTNATMLILCLVYSILAFIIYHKIFTVTYIGKGALSHEIFGCFVVGFLLTGFTLYFWKITLIIIILVSLAGISKYKDPTIRAFIGIVSVLIAVMIVVAGNKLKADVETEEKESSVKYEEKGYGDVDEYENDNEYIDDEGDGNNDGYGDSSGYADEENEDSDIYTDAYRYESNNGYADDEEYKDDDEYVDNTNIDDEDLSDYFIFEDSDKRYLKGSELQTYDAETLRLARNEIYARHGRKFQDTELQAYFESMPWYNGRLDPEEFSEDVLNSYEKKNLKKITQYENK